MGDGGEIKERGGGNRGIGGMVFASNYPKKKKQMKLLGNFILCIAAAAAAAAAAVAEARSR